MTATVKILKCNDSSKWYANEIGNEFGLISEEEVEWMVREPSGYLNFISKEDCEITSFGEGYDTTQNV